MADDLMRFEQARAALKRLARSGEIPLRPHEIFEGGEPWRSWPRQILRRAVAAGVVLVIPKKHNRERSFYVAGSGLAEVVGNAEKLRAVLWPEDAIEVAPAGDGAGDAEDDALEWSRYFDSLDKEESEDDENEGEGDREVLSDGESKDLPTARELLEGTLKVGAAILENVVYLRTKVDELEKQIATIVDALELRDGEAADE